MKLVPVDKAPAKRKFKLTPVGAKQDKGPEYGTAETVPEWGRENPNLYGVVGAARETLGPVADGLMTAGGSIIGGGGGSLAAPGAGTAAGVVGGGALGHGIYKNLERRADEFLGNRPVNTLEEEALQTGYDVAEGALYEAGGRAIPEVLRLGASVAKTVPKVLKASALPVRTAKKLADKSPVSDATARVRAGQLLERETTPHNIEMADQAKINVREVDDISSSMNLDRPSMAQRTGDHSTARLEQSLGVSDPDFARTVELNDAKIVRQARNSIDETFLGADSARSAEVQARAGAGDVVEELGNQHEALKRTARQAQEASEQADTALNRADNSQIVGRDIHQVVKQARDAERVNVKTLYDNLGDAKMDTQPILDEAVALVDDAKTSLDDELHPYVKRAVQLLSDDPLVAGAKGSKYGDYVRDLTAELDHLKSADYGNHFVDGNRTNRSWSAAPTWFKKLPSMSKSRAANAITRAIKGESLDAVDEDIVDTIIHDLKSRPGYKPAGSKLTARTDIGLKDLIEIKSQLSGALRGLRSQGAEYGKQRQLSKLLNGVEDSIARMENGNGQLADDFKRANDAYRQYTQTFRTGPAGQILKSGKGGEASAVEFSDIPGKFFKTGNLDKADSLVNAVGGKERAGSFVRDYAYHQLASKAGGGELTAKQVRQFVGKNRHNLERFGLLDEFSDIQKVKETAEAAVGRVQEIEKSLAGKMLGVDPEKAIAEIFKGKSGKNGAVEMGRMVRQLSGNPAALRGLKNGVKDYLLNNATVRSAEDALGNAKTSLDAYTKFLKNNDAALKVLYQGEPEKVTALHDYGKVLRVLGRNKNVTASGGSTTAEKSMFGRLDSNVDLGKSVATAGAVMKGLGWTVNAALRVLGKVFKGPMDAHKEQVRTLIKNAMFDPELADDLMRAGRARLPKDTQKRVAERIRNHATKLGVAVEPNKGQAAALAGARTALVDAPQWADQMAADMTDFLTEHSKQEKGKKE